MVNHIFGATYQQGNNPENTVTLLGILSKTVILTDGLTTYELNKNLFNEEYTPTGQHDHKGYCCPEHNTHTTPHKGCILR